MAKYRYLELTDRQELAQRYRAGERVLDIATQLGIHPATVYHELERGRTDELDENQRPVYDPVKAQRSFQEGLRRRGHRRS